MASPEETETPILPPPPPSPPPPPDVTPEFARPVAYGTLSQVVNTLNAAFDSIGRQDTRKVAETWTDEFWAVSGYEKAAVMAAFDQLEALERTYRSDYYDDVTVLATQAPE
jgi:hypothetical protein